MRYLLLGYLFCSACSFLVGARLPESCEDGAVSFCDGDVQVLCQGGLTVRLDCAPDFCDPVLGACQRCGNGNLDNGEECDDGNLIDGDGCDSNCTQTACGNGIASPGELCYEPAVTFATGQNPVQLAAGDIDADQNLDLITANDNPNKLDSLTFLKGLGNGNFAPKEDIALGFGKETIALGDINNDGNLDVATAKGGTVRILINQGNGNFGASVQVGNGGNHIALAFADADGDGLQDLITYNKAFEAVSIFLNLGGGTFNVQPDQEITTGNHQTMAVADINNDTRPDVILGGIEGLFQVFANEGVNPQTQQLDFDLATSFNIGHAINAVTVGDLDGQGAQDVVLASGDNNLVTLLFAEFQGDLSFPIETQESVTAIAGAVTLADFDNNGLLDIAAASPDAGDISILLNSGDRVFQAAQSFPIGAGASSLVAGDFNEDGIPDLAVTLPSASQVSLLRSAAP